MSTTGRRKKQGSPNLPRLTSVLKAGKEREGEDKSQGEKRKATLREEHGQRKKGRTDQIPETEKESDRKEKKDERSAFVPSSAVNGQAADLDRKVTSELHGERESSASERNSNLRNKEGKSQKEHNERKPPPDERDGNDSATRDAPVQAKPIMRQVEKKEDKTAPASTTTSADSPVKEDKFGKDGPSNLISIPEVLQKDLSPHPSTHSESKTIDYDDDQEDKELNKKPNGARHKTASKTPRSQPNTSRDRVASPKASPNRSSPDPLPDAPVQRNPQRITSPPPVGLHVMKLADRASSSPSHSNSNPSLHSESTTPPPPPHMLGKPRKRPSSSGLVRKYARSKLSPEDVLQLHSSTCARIVGKDGATFGEALEELDKLEKGMKRRGRPSKHILKQKRKAKELRERLKKEMKEMGGSEEGAVTRGKIDEESSDDNSSDESERGDEGTGAPSLRKGPELRRKQSGVKEDGSSEDSGDLGEDEVAGAVPKRRPGRPRKHSKESESEGEQEDVGSGAPVRRGPGRPRKQAEVHRSDSSEESDGEREEGSGIMPSKRGPGRPRKHFPEKKESSSEESDEEKEKETTAPPVKRGPGRPRKHFPAKKVSSSEDSNEENERETIAPPVKRGPGRPRKHFPTKKVSSSEESDEEKEREPVAPPVKRGPGRPRKHFPEKKESSSEESDGEKERETVAPLVKRGPGRPRKHFPERKESSSEESDEEKEREIAAPLVKRGPGRPRKHFVQRKGEGSSEGSEKDIGDGKSMTESQGNRRRRGGKYIKEGRMSIGYKRGGKHRKENEGGDRRRYALLVNRYEEKEQEVEKLQGELRRVKERLEREEGRAAALEDALQHGRKNEDGKSKEGELAMRGMLMEIRRLEAEVETWKKKRVIVTEDIERVAQLEGMLEEGEEEMNRLSRMVEKQAKALKGVLKANHVLQQKLYAINGSERC